jgi:hypothetical protein
MTDLGEPHPVRSTSRMVTRDGTVGVECGESGVDHTGKERRTLQNREHVLPFTRS